MRFRRFMRRPLFILAAWPVVWIALTSCSGPRPAPSSTSPPPTASDSASSGVDREPTSTTDNAGGAPSEPGESVDERRAVGTDPASVQHVYYLVYWQDIHVLTAYRGRGSLRSEDPDDPASRLDGTCDYMSAVSHYIEQEVHLWPLIQQADDMDEFLQLLRQEGYEIETERMSNGY